jgi:hypothetical protein
MLSPSLRPLHLLLCAATATALAAPAPAHAQAPAGQPPDPAAQPPAQPAETAAEQTGSAEQPPTDSVAAQPSTEPADARSRAEVADSSRAASGVDLEVHGRVFAAAAYEDQRVESSPVDRAQTAAENLSLSVPSARASLKVSMLDWASVVIEAEVAGNVRLRDGYVQARKKRWLARAGQFKMPISSFHLESPWTLPVARRGWLHELLSDHMLLTGRREGFMGRIEGGGFWDPSLTLGAFRSVQWGPDSGDPVESLSPTEQTLVARVASTPGGVEIAAVGQRRVTQQPEGLTGYWAGGFDATGDVEFERTGLRFWAESLAGTSWFKTAPASSAIATFVEARALAAWRWGGLQRGAPYLEAFAGGGLLEPDTAVVDDLFVEVMAGVNVGHWRSTRLTLQLEHNRAGRNFPRGMFFDFEKLFLASHRAALLQVGAAF